MVTGLQGFAEAFLRFAGSAGIDILHTGDRLSRMFMRSREESRLWLIAGRQNRHSSKSRHASPSYLQVFNTRHSGTRSCADPESRRVHRTDSGFARERSRPGMTMLRLARRLARPTSNQIAAWHTASIPTERRIIGSVIAAQTGRSVVAAARCDACIPECINLGLPLRLEAPVTTGVLVGLRPFADRDVDAIRMSRPRAFAVAKPVVAATDFHDTQRIHDRVVEALGRGNVGHHDGHMIQHRSPPGHDPEKVKTGFRKKSCPKN